MQIYLVSRRALEGLPNTFVIHGTYGSRASAQAEVDRRMAEHDINRKQHDADVTAAGQEPPPFPEMFPAASAYLFMTEASDG